MVVRQLVLPSLPFPCIRCRATSADGVRGITFYGWYARSKAASMRGSMPSFREQFLTLQYCPRVIPVWRICMSHHLTAFCFCTAAGWSMPRRWPAVRAMWRQARAAINWLPDDATSQRRHAQHRAEPVDEFPAASDKSVAGI